MSSIYNFGAGVSDGKIFELMTTKVVEYFRRYIYMKVEQKTIRLTEEESKTLWRAEMLCRGIENEVNKIIDLNDKEKEEMTKELGVFRHLLCLSQYDVEVRFPIF